MTNHDSPKAIFRVGRNRAEHVKRTSVRAGTVGHLISRKSAKTSAEARIARWNVYD